MASTYAPVRRVGACPLSSRTCCRCPSAKALALLLAIRGRSALISDAAEEDDEGSHHTSAVAVVGTTNSDGTQGSASTTISSSTPDAEQQDFWVGHMEAKTRTRSGTRRSLQHIKCNNAAAVTTVMEAPRRAGGYPVVELVPLEWNMNVWHYGCAHGRPNKRSCPREASATEKSYGTAGTAARETRCQICAKVIKVKDAWRIATCPQSPVQDDRCFRAQSASFDGQGAQTTWS